MVKLVLLLLLGMTAVLRGAAADFDVVIYGGTSAAVQVKKMGRPVVIVPGDPPSGVLPRVSAAHPGEYGAGDHKVQAYCFRMCLTDHPDNRIPFARPDGYDPRQYELLARIYAAGWKDTFNKFDLIPNRKTDTNNHGPFSTDNIGMNYDYPEASYERRRAIIKAHEIYQKGWLYFIATDLRVPADVRERMKRWGLAKDEFKDHGGWPHQIYVREARRMIGAYVMTENELLKRRATPDSVGMGSYTIDSHNVQRYITPEGHVQNEATSGCRRRGPTKFQKGRVPKRTGQSGEIPKRDRSQKGRVQKGTGQSGETRMRNAPEGTGYCTRNCATEGTG